MTRRSALTIPLAAATLAVGAATAAAATPANDTRQAPQTLTVPAQVSGTTLEATRDDTDPAPGCGPQPGPSVWYRLDGTTDGRVALELTAAEGAGYAVSVYRRQGGDLEQVECDTTGEDGTAGLYITADKGDRYLVQVTSGVRADAGTFQLRAYRPEAPPNLPGPALPAGGARGTVDVVADPEDAFALPVVSGTTYRINLATPDPCTVSLRVLPPQGRTDLPTPRTRACRGYLMFTPGPEAGGVYSLLVEANSSGQRRVRYRLTAAPLGGDDQAPGLALPLRTVVRGAVSARGIDRLDLYRFTVTHRSTERVRLRTEGALDLKLMTAAGRTLSCACDEETGGKEVERDLAPGDYLVLVRATGWSAGRYRLLRGERTITRSRISASASGRDVSVRVSVSPAPDGGTVTVDAFQYDPLDGWRFRARLAGVVRGGTAGFRYRATGPGPWRFTGRYAGTGSSSPSSTGTARLEVRG